MMEIYGGGYNDDVDYFKYNMRNDATHTHSMIEQLEHVIHCYDLALTSIEMQKRDTMLGSVTVYKD